jgi:DNA-binding GntR family transcriptional regulator
MAAAADMAPVATDSVVDRAYERIRALVLDGDLPPGSRLGQVELAERLGISRTPVREALRRLSAENLVEFRPNRGYWAVDLGLEAVLRRLEVRLLLEPGIARLAAERRTDADLERLQAAIDRQKRARRGVAAHDASRDFHLMLARATGNEELVRVFESLWLVEVGRRLLSRRSARSNWERGDVAEHQELLDAIAAGDGELTAALMQAHVRGALGHWEPELPKAAPPRPSR